MKRHLQSAAVLLCAAFLTACALSPAAAVRRQPLPGKLTDLQVRQRVPWRGGAIVYYTFDRLDSSGKTISECGSATYVERDLLGWHLRGGGGIFCTPHAASARPFARAGSQGSLCKGAGLRSETYGLVTDPAAVEVRVTWSDGLTETVALVNESYLVVRADEVIVEQIEALDATGTVVATLTMSASAKPPPPASPQPTATRPPAQAPTSAFPRTIALRLPDAPNADSLEVESEYTLTPVWAAYTSPTYCVTLQYPASWQHTPRYGGERYGGEDGFFCLNALGGGNRTIDQVTPFVAHHKLQPYGSDPTIESPQIGGQEARLILPSDDQPEGMKGHAALIVQYPQPVQIDDTRYRYFILYADQDHIREIAHTLAFTVQPEGWP